MGKLSKEDWIEILASEKRNFILFGLGILVLVLGVLYAKIFSRLHLGLFGASFFLFAFIFLLKTIEQKAKRIAKKKTRRLE